MAEVQSSGRGASAVKSTEPMLRTPRSKGGAAEDRTSDSNEGPLVDINLMISSNELVQVLNVVTAQCGAPR